MGSDIAPWDSTAFDLVYFSECNAHRRLVGTGWLGKQRLPIGTYVPREVTGRAHGLSTTTTLIRSSDARRKRGPCNTNIYRSH